MKGWTVALFPSRKAKLWADRRNSIAWSLIVEHDLIMTDGRNIPAVFQKGTFAQQQRKSI
jgi:hypothetical protein